MSEEEKKAIEGLFHLSHINTYLDLEKNAVIKISSPIIERWKDETKIILNLIDKQQKEIEELNKSDASKEQSSMDYYNLYKELEDKIKAQIEELDKKYKEAYDKGFKTDMINRLREIKLMQSLLEKE